MEPTRSMWVEADCNLSSGESLVRQMLHGKNFWLDEFGYETRDVWIPDVFGYVDNGGISLDNGILRVTFAVNGELAGVYGHRARREALAAGPGLAGNRFQLHPDHPNAWDAWDVDAFYRETVEDLSETPETLEIVENGPLRATVRTVRRFGNGSLIEQHVHLCAGSPRLDFATRCDLLERRETELPVTTADGRVSFDVTPFQIVTLLFPLIENAALARRGRLTDPEQPARSRTTRFSVVAQFGKAAGRAGYP